MDMEFLICFCFLFQIFPEGPPASLLQSNITTSVSSTTSSDPENGISPRNPNRNSKKGRAPEPPSPKPPQAAKRSGKYNYKK